MNLNQYSSPEILLIFSILLAFLFIKSKHLVEKERYSYDKFWIDFSKRTGLVHNNTSFFDPNLASGIYYDYQVNIDFNAIGGELGIGDISTRIHVTLKHKKADYILMNKIYQPKLKKSLTRLEKNYQTYKIDCQNDEMLETVLLSEEIRSRFLLVDISQLIITSGKLSISSAEVICDINRLCLLLDFSIKLAEIIDNSATNIISSPVSIVA